MANINIIGYGYYMKPPSPEQAPEISITAEAYHALAEKNPQSAIMYAADYPIFNTVSGRPSVGDISTNEQGETMLWTTEMTTAFNAKIDGLA